MTYFLLVTRDGPGAKFRIQFGAYNRDVVFQERIDSYSHVKAKDRKILTIPSARHKDCLAAVDKLNNTTQGE